MSAISSLASTVRLLTTESPELVLYLDLGATEVVRWSGGVRCAVEAMGLWGPGHLRALSQLAIFEKEESFCVVLTEKPQEHLLIKEKVKYAVVANDELYDWCTSIGLRTSRTTLSFITPLSSSNKEGEELILTLIGRSSQVFPVLPWQVRSGSSTSFKADDVEPELRQQLKHLAKDIACLAAQLDMDIRRGARALGATAQLVTTAVVTAAAERRGQRSATIVIVDRTADLKGAARHILDPPLLDRILTAIPRHRASSTYGDYSCEPKVTNFQWGFPKEEDQSLMSTPPKWSQALLNVWPAGGSLSGAYNGRDLALSAFVKTHTGDEGLSTLTSACAKVIHENGHSGVPPKAGRGKGAELLEHLKLLLRYGSSAQDILKITPLTWLAIDAVQRTRRSPGAPKPDLIEPIIDQLAANDAEREQLFAVLLEARGREALSQQGATILAVRACALAPGTLSQATASALADSCQKPHHTIKRLDSLSLHRHQISLLRLLDDLLAARPTDNLLTPVGGALESFVGASIPGFSRLLGRSATSPVKPSKPSGDNVILPDLLFFVIGGITPTEVAAFEACIRGYRRTAFGQSRRIVLATTMLISHSAFADRFFEDRFLVSKNDNIKNLF